MDDSEVDDSQVDDPMTAMGPAGSGTATAVPTPVPATYSLIPDPTAAPPQLQSAAQQPQAAPSPRCGPRSTGAPGSTLRVSSFPLEIRIGPERHGYEYMLHFPSGVYRCERGSDWANFGDRLFLYRTTGGPRP